MASGSPQSMDLREEAFYDTVSEASAGDETDASSVLGSGRSPGDGNGNPLWYSCLGKSHGQRILAGYSPGGHKELDMTDWLSAAAEKSRAVISVLYCSLSLTFKESGIQLYLLLSIYLFFRSYFFAHTTCGILVPQPGVKPTPTSLEAQSLNCWTTGKYLNSTFWNF